LKLLFDANLSPKLARRLADLFSDSAHIVAAGLDHCTSDLNIWDYAKTNGFAIVTADADFIQLSETFGAPPHVIRMENCNYKTALVESLLRRNAIRIAAMERNGAAVLLIRNSA
jgi:predicted nuclease of predicted toxin-antitoxin system